MTPRPKPKVKKNIETKKIIIAAVAFALGYYMLNHVATWEKPPLGNTFHIVLGCAIMAVSGIALIVLLKSRFFPKKKRKSRTSHVFLDDVLKKEPHHKKTSNGEPTT